MMTFRTAALLIGIVLAVSLGPATANSGGDTGVADSASIDTAAVDQPIPQEKDPVSDPIQQPASYDSFVDENKNGVDDKFETEEKSRVKVNVIHAPNKPNRDKEPGEKKKPDTP